MTNKILPHLDLPEDQNISPELADRLDEQGIQQFLDSWRASGEYDPAEDNSENGSLLAGWINSRGVVFSLRNCWVAWRDLRTDGLLVRKAPQPAVTVVPRGAEPTPVLSESALRKSSPAGRPISPELKQQYERELAEQRERNRDASMPVPMTLEEARQNFADKPYESDIARKKRDRNLRAEAVASRVAIAKAKGTHNRGL